MKETIKLLKWVKVSCKPRTTSRDNIYATYWQMNNSGVLYTDEELFKFWEKNING